MRCFGLRSDVSTGIVIKMGLLKFFTGIADVAFAYDTVKPIRGDLSLKPGASGANPCAWV
jgi:hypothetical protein